MTMNSGDLRIDQIIPELANRWLQIDFEECLSQETFSFTKLKKKDIKQIGKIPVIDQGEEFISGYIDDYNKSYNGSLPIIIFGDHTRRIKYVDFKFAVGADGTKILRPKKFFIEKLFYYYLKSLNIESQGYSRHYRFLKQINVPVPPLNEQNRIVEKLDTLLLKVESVKLRLEKIPNLLNQFRQSVLSAAVTGELTKDWRIKNPNTKKNRYKKR